MDIPRITIYMGSCINVMIFQTGYRAWSSLRADACLLVSEPSQISPEPCSQELLNNYDNKVGS